MTATVSKVKVGDKGKMVTPSGGMVPCRVIATDAKGPDGASLVVIYKTSKGDELAYVVHETLTRLGYYFEKEPTYLYRNEYTPSSTAPWCSSLAGAKCSVSEYGSYEHIGVLRCEVDDYGEKKNFTFIPKEEVE